MTGASSGPGPHWLRLVSVFLAGMATLLLAFTFFTLSADARKAEEEGRGEEISWAFDFGAYRGGAARIAAAGSPYDETVTAGKFFPGPKDLYHYSPVLAVSLLPLDGLPDEASTAWWYWLHVAALMAACALMPISGTLRLLAYAVGAFSLALLVDIVMGNVNVPLLLLMVLAWRWLDRPLGSIGVAVSMALRPSLGLLLIWQLLRRAWRAVAWTVGAGLVLVLATLPFVGFDSYLEYLGVLRNVEMPVNADAPPGAWQNIDLGEAVRNLGLGDTAVAVARIASLSVGLGAMVASLRRRPEVGFMVTLMASFMVVPLLWDHYLAMTLLPAAFLAQHWHRAALALPLLSWLPLAAPLLLMGTIVLLFLVTDESETRAVVSAEASA